MPSTVPPSPLRGAGGGSNRTTLAAAISVLLAATPAVAAVHERTLELPQIPSVGSIHYGISIPDDGDARKPRPLVLALHPGGDLRPGYGAQYLSGFFLPALRGLDAIVVAPDTPRRSWADEVVADAVMALLAAVIRENAIDRSRILVTGYSMGGRGTWFMSARHADFFTAAIPIAGAPGQSIDVLGRIPTYAIHSASDEVVPIGPDREMCQELEKLGRPVRFEGVEGRGHFDTRSYGAAYGRAVQWVQERWRER